MERMRVLIAEDKPRMAGMLQRALLREGYLVSIATYRLIERRAQALAKQLTSEENAS